MTGTHAPLPPPPPRLPLVLGEAEVGDAQFRSALDEFQAGNSQKFGSLAAGDEAPPVQLEYNHFTRRLLDRLAQSRQETAEVFAEVQNSGIHRGCSSFMVPLTSGRQVSSRDTSSRQRRPRDRTGRRRATRSSRYTHPLKTAFFAHARPDHAFASQLAEFLERSEERRVGKECRSPGS